MSCSAETNSSCSTRSHHRSNESINCTLVQQKIPYGITSAPNESTNTQFCTQTRNSTFQRYSRREWIQNTTLNSWKSLVISQETTSVHQYGKEYKLFTTRSLMFNLLLFYQNIVPRNLHATFQLITLIVLSINCPEFSSILIQIWLFSMANTWL